MYTLQKTINICCAHHLTDSQSLVTKQCLNDHGHNYKIKIQLTTYSLIDGMVIDFGKIKEIVNALDHQNLNKFINQPTAENLAKYIHDKIQKEVERRSDTVMIKIEVEETPGSLAIYEI